jgi:TolB-like protein/DNA-binding winged helix-turn-helix (wHTH) protein/Tfp pilus assembly protein PilF
VTDGVIPAHALDAGFRLGDWIVRPRHGTVERESGAERLEPRVMSALVCMAARPGDTVTREEFIRDVWMGRVVSDEVLSRCISILRSTFDDHAHDPRIIQTIPKVGYRLIAPIQPLELPVPSTVEPAANSVETPPEPERRGGLLLELRRRNVFRVAAAYGIVGWLLIEVLRRAIEQNAGPGWLPPLATTLVLLGWPIVLTLTWLFEPTKSGFKPSTKVRSGESLADLTGRRLDYVILIALVGALIYALSAPLQRGPSADADMPAAEPNTVAVLPFENLGPGDADDYLSDGLSEELMTRLAAIPGLKVVARTSAFAMKGQAADVREVARRLGVEYVVEGSLRRQGDRVRITAQFIDARRGYEIWSQSFEGSMTEIFEMQDRIALAIVGQLPASLRQLGAQALGDGESPTASIDAYQLFLRGRRQLAIREEGNVRHAIALFEKALEHDRTYADAWVELAKAQALLPSYSIELPEEMHELALTTIATGAAHDPRVADRARDVSAFIDYSRWRWLEAQRGFDAALAERPGDSNLLQWYSQFLAAVGRPADSLDYALRARSIDVLSPVVNDRLAVAYMWTDQDELAERQFEVSRELGIRIAAQPDAYLLLLLRRGRYDEARTLAMTLQRMFARPTDWLDPFLDYLRGTGSREAAIAALDRAEQERAVSRRYALGAWLFLGEDGRAMQSALELVRDPAEFEVELVFAREADGLRRHPRFGELAKALGLESYWDSTTWPANCRRDAGMITCG